NGSAIFDHIVRKAPIEHAIEEFRFFTERAAAQQRAQGIAYAEQRMILTNMALENCKTLYAAALEHLAGLCDKEHTTRAAIGLPRNDPWPQWRMVKELALGPHGQCLTGIDFCYIEEGFPPKNVAALFRDVRAFNHAHPSRALAILYHVGESFAD